jgi:hypothetical protein
MQARLEIGNAWSKFEEHVDNVSRYHAHLPWVSDFKAIFGNKEFKQALEAKIGRPAMMELRERILSEAIPSPTIETLGSSILKQNAGVLVASPGAMFTSVSSIFGVLGRYPGKIGVIARAFPAAMKATVLGARELAQLKSHVPHARERYEHFRSTMSGGLFGADTSRTAPRLLDKGLGVTVEPFDKLNSIWRWAAAKALVADRFPTMNQNSDEFFKLAGDEWVLMTQRVENTSNGLDMSSLSLKARKNSILALTIPFTSATQKMFAQLAHSVQLMRNPSRAKEGRVLLYGTLAMYAASAFITEAISTAKGNVPEDDEDDPFGSFLKRFFFRIPAEILGTIQAAGPVLVGLYKSFQTGRLNMSDSNFLVSLVAQTGTAGYQLWKAVEAKVNEEYDSKGESVANQRALRAAENLLPALTVKTGFPFTAAKQWGQIGYTALKEDDEIPDPEDKPDTKPQRNLIYRSILDLSGADTPLQRKAAQGRFNRAVKALEAKQGEPIDEEYLERLLDGRWNRTLKAMDEGTVAPAVEARKRAEYDAHTSALSELWDGFDG